MSFILENKFKKLTDFNKKLTYGYIRDVLDHKFNIAKILILLIVIYYQVDDEWINSKFVGYKFDKHNRKVIRNTNRYGIYCRIYGKKIMNKNINNNIMYTWEIEIKSTHDYFFGIIDQEIEDSGIFLLNGISHIFNSLCVSDNNNISANKINDIIIIKLMYYTNYAKIQIWKNKKLDIDTRIKKCDGYRLFSSFAYSDSSITIKLFRETIILN